MMRAFWVARSKSDRRTLVLGAAVVGALLIWALIWHPLALARTALAAQVDADREALAWMTQAQLQLPQFAQKRSATIDRQGKSLLALADMTARGANLASALKRVEPTGPRSVRVSLESASFDAIVRWMEALASDYGVQVSDFTAERAAGLGLVNARIILEDQ